MLPVVYKFKLAKNVLGSEVQTLRLAVSTSFFLILFLVLAITSRTYIFSLSDKNFLLPTLGAQTSPTSQDHNNSELLYDSTREDSKAEGKLMCDNSGTRSIICEMRGDVRINRNSSSIVLVLQSSRTNTSESNEPFRIKPHARKGDAIAMSNVKEVLILKSSKDRNDAPCCNVNHHSTPAIVFSAGGYAGNLFHDFIDILVPLFLTSHQYSREVQFLITDLHPRWITRHHLVLAKLSRYEIIDLDRDIGSVHCYQHVIVGLRNHNEFYIDPKLPPVGHSLANFTQFMRNAYSLEKETLSKIISRKPRLLIISRKWSRSFTNINQIVRMAEGLGYIVVVTEPTGKTDVAELARLVNSCDVMMGVHGAGLSNFVFLPTNATLIQIVPWGKFEGICRYSFGFPATNANLRYIQYEIGVEESTLIDMYPRDDPVISDPLLVHKQGWGAFRLAYLVKQNVRLNVTRFKPVLLDALKMIHQ